MNAPGAPGAGGAGGGGGAPPAGPPPGAGAGAGAGAGGAAAPRPPGAPAGPAPGPGPAAPAGGGGAAPAPGPPAPEPAPPQAAPPPPAPAAAGLPAPAAAAPAAGAAAAAGAGLATGPIIPPGAPIPGAGAVIPAAGSLAEAPVGNPVGFTGGLIGLGGVGGTPPATNFAIPPIGVPPAPPIDMTVRLPTSAAACTAFQAPATAPGVASMYILGCLQLTGGWACTADQLAAPVAAPSCMIERMYPNCSAAGYRPPPTTPGQTSSVVLGCLGTSAGLETMRCRLDIEDGANPTGGGTGAMGPCAEPAPVTTEAATSTASAPKPTQTATKDPEYEDPGTSVANSNDAAGGKRVTPAWRWWLLLYVAAMAVAVAH
ncbi:hypothetical protein H9P43_002786 [Blastocladiella emersonii ATCC 22665]|nr:hypothetical protein H9P43_002786 [Blastocladiella emersonii ATCC 22665]